MRAIAPTIDLHRQSRGLLNKRENITATEEEVNKFLFSIPYFDRPLCYYLMGDGKVGREETSLWVTSNWITEFSKRVEYWAESFEWLHGELILIHYPGFMGRAMVDDSQLIFPRLIFNVKAN